MEEEDAAAGEEEEAPAGARKRKRGGEEMAEEEEQEGGEKKQGPRLLSKEDEECYEGIAEEAVEDLMRWLEAEIADDAPGFVTINGNEESCGPSFSCAASTVMASVDTRAGAPPPPPVPWPFPDATPADDEDAWLAELLLACGPALEGVQL